MSVIYRQSCGSRRLQAYTQDYGGVGSVGGSVYWFDAQGLSTVANPSRARNSRDFREIRTVELFIDEPTNKHCSDIV